LIDDDEKISCRSSDGARAVPPDGKQLEASAWTTTHNPHGRPVSYS
jgi:hypothetical protein